MSSEILKTKMIALLSDGTAWCKGSNAISATGNPVPIGSPLAVKWDVFGALSKCNQGSNNFKDYQEVYAELKNNIPQSHKNRDIEKYNDETDFQGILNLINGVV